MHAGVTGGQYKDKKGKNYEKKVKSKNVKNKNFEKQKNNNFSPIKNIFSKN